ncbi:hypothetical protein MN608_00936 [Microdochium nivale]|nr:hypothetical protein MN608_00936 [Microdochium nivale]
MGPRTATRLAVVLAKSQRSTEHSGKVRHASFAGCFSTSHRARSRQELAPMVADMFQTDAGTMVFKLAKHALNHKDGNEGARHRVQRPLNTPWLRYTACPRRTRTKGGAFKPSSLI